MFLADLCATTMSSAGKTEILCPYIPWAENTPRPTSIHPVWPCLLSKDGSDTQDAWSWTDPPYVCEKSDSCPAIEMAWQILQPWQRDQSCRCAHTCRIFCPFPSAVPPKATPLRPSQPQLTGTGVSLPASLLKPPGKVVAVDHVAGHAIIDADVLARDDTHLVSGIT